MIVQPPHCRDSARRSLPGVRADAGMPGAIRRLAGAAIAMTLIAACAREAPFLNSERIAEAFGNYGIAIIDATETKRIANLYSTEDGRQTTRTYAIVEFALPVDPSLREEHDLVVSGQSLGEVFKSRGWRIAKQNVRIGTRRLKSADREIAALMRVKLPCEVALHEYDLFVSRDGAPLRYARITELHHPDYLTREDLERIYGDGQQTAKQLSWKRLHRH